MRNSNIKYQSKATRLSESLSKDIEQGRFAFKKPLPSETELAEQYEVSRSTIRKVISHLTKIGKLIKEPHRGVWISQSEAKNLKTAHAVKTKPKPEKTYSIAAVWAAYPDALTVEISEGIKKYCLDNPEIKLQLLTSETGHAESINILEHVREYDIDGLIVLPYENAEYHRALEKLATENYPIVCVDRQIYGVELNTVKVDNSYGMYTAATKLIMKYRRPVYFFGPEPGVQPQKERYDGYCRAMLDAGFEASIKQNSYYFDCRDSDPSYWPITKKWELPYNAALEMLREITTPCSIVCLNDYAAKGVYEAADKLGLKIGKDIKLIGFDDLPMASCLTPTLSSVLQPRKHIGHEAARILHKLLTGKIRNKMNISLPVQLIERESS
jgi:DNA-binding LacI/PurR family transcriptional regulator